MRCYKYAAAAIASLALLGPGLSARADEITTTTTTRTTTDVPPDPGAIVAVPGVVGVHIGEPRVREGCSTTKTTHTDEDTGDSVTRKTTTCD
jgi:hypothetical protein